MTGRFFLFLALCCAYGILGAQSPESKNFRLADVSLYYGVWFQEAHQANLEDFVQLAPESEFATTDFTQYQPGPRFRYSGEPDISLLTNLKLVDRTNGHRGHYLNLRLGLSYGGGEFFSGYYSREERYPKDTLQSAGTPYYLDSLVTSSYYMDYRHNKLGLHAALTWSTNPRYRIRFYGGAGAHFSYAIATTSFSKMDKSFLANGSRPVVAEYWNYEMQNEHVRNHPSLGFGVYAPLGIDFRVGKKRQWLKPWHLFYEFRPGMDFMHVPELNKTYSRFRLYRGVGVGYSF